MKGWKDEVYSTGTFLMESLLYPVNATPAVAKLQPNGD